MAHWRWQTDLLSSWKPLAAYGAYLAYLWLRAPFYTDLPHYSPAGLPVAGGNVYFYLQLLPCVFIVLITTCVFEETFRKSGREYFPVFPAGAGTVILKRYFRLWALVGAMHIPLCLFAVRRINLSIAVCLAEYPELAGFPPIPVWPILVQCLIALGFYISLTLILLLLFKNRYLPNILIIIYCLMEYGPLRAVLGKYALFYGCAASPDLYTLLPPNMYILAGLALVFTAVTCLSFTRSAGGFSAARQCPPSRRCSKDM